MIYLDNAASTKPRKEVIEEMIRVMNNEYANPDAIHEYAHKTLLNMKNQKEKMARLLGLNSKEIYFTAGGSDGNNIIIQGIVEANSRNKKHLITTKIEHSSVYEIFRNYEKEGYEVDYLDVSEYGEVDVEQLERLIREDTILVSIIAVNSEIGIIQDLEKISKIIKNKNKETYFHTDFVQGLGHTKVDFSKLEIDAITITSHKINGPKGIGAIYINKNVKIKEIMYGTNKENGIIKRTLPTELIFGFIKAIEMAYNNYEKEVKYIYELKKYFIEQLKKNIDKIRINSLLELEKSTPTILNVSFGGVKGEVLTSFLGMYEIYVSTGSACSSRRGNSRIIESLGVPNEQVEGAIRFSFSIDNTVEEVDIVIQKLIECVTQIRMMK
ncbi:MAG: cysteine desulfurase [Leptotrichiaceae bacterium]|nr:cysteine desulfurase [Leptotrichiaceae bacterium]